MGDHEGEGKRSGQGAHPGQCRDLQPSPWLRLLVPTTNPALTPHPRWPLTNSEPEGQAAWKGAGATWCSHQLLKLGRVYLLEAIQSETTKVTGGARCQDRGGETFLLYPGTDPPPLPGGWDTDCLAPSYKLAPDLVLGGSEPSDHLPLAERTSPLGGNSSLKFRVWKQPGAAGEEAAWGHVGKEGTAWSRQRVRTSRAPSSSSLSSSPEVPSPVTAPAPCPAPSL